MRWLIYPLVVFAVTWWVITGIQLVRVWRLRRTTWQQPAPEPELPDWANPESPLYDPVRLLKEYGQRVGSNPPPPTGRPRPRPPLNPPRVRNHDT